MYQQFIVHLKVGRAPGQGKVYDLEERVKLGCMEKPNQVAIISFIPIEVMRP